MSLVFDHRIFRHINETAVKETGRTSNLFRLLEKLLQRKWIVGPLAVFEWMLGFLLTLPLPVYSSVVYWVITNMRGLPHFTGMYARSLYYRRKLGGMGSNVLIEQNVFFAYPKSVFLSEFSYIDKGVMILSKRAKVGRRVHIAPRVFISGGDEFEIESYAGIATNVNIITATEVLKDGARCSGPMVSAHQRDVFRGKVLVRREAFIGANATILPGVTVAEGSVVGAGVTITKSTEAWGVYAGFRSKKITMRTPVRWEED